MFRMIGLASLASCLLVACTDDASSSRTVTYSASTLTSLGSGYVYEGWLVVGDGPHSAGRFTVENGAPMPATVTVDAAVADAAVAVVVTIEPATGDDPAPSSVHVLAGDLAQGAADLKVSHAKALGTDFTSAAGSFVLATPSTASNSADNNQGIWFLTPPSGGGAPTPALTLPTLPAGWMYEGWVASSAGPVSTGKFLTPSGADSDGGGSTAGTDATPPFPGQDFIAPATVLTSGFRTVITVEPDPDDASTPFAIKPLIADPIGAATAPTPQQLVNQAATNVPSVHVTIE